MKHIFQLVTYFFFFANLSAQVYQNFDDNFCNRYTSCWERYQAADIGNPRNANSLAESICTAAIQNTTTPITGTGSLKGEFHFPVLGQELYFYHDTIYSTANGVNGNTVSFKIRFSQLNFNTADLNFFVNVTCGNFISTHTYTPANQGFTFTINETIAGAGAGGAIKIILTATGQTFSAFDLVYDIDDFITTASADLSNPCTATALPVKLINFLANSTGCKVVLNWKTALEENVSHFEIQRSSDGISFTTIDRVKASNSPIGSEYQYSDNTSNSDNNYYKLLIVDFDGRKEYSRVLLQNGCVNSISIIPNPAQNFLRLSELKKGSVIYIINTLGKIVHTKIPTQSTETINISGLPKGIYIIAMLNNGTGQRVTSTFLKQ